VLLAEKVHFLELAALAPTAFEIQEALKAEANSGLQLAHIFADMSLVGAERWCEVWLFFEIWPGSSVGGVASGMCSVRRRARRA
jgi:hypothetical protein